MKSVEIVKIVIAVVLILLGWSLADFTNNQQIMGAGIMTGAALALYRDLTKSPILAIMKSLLESARTAERIITHYGLNKTERGEPHPQELALTQLRNAIEKAEAKILE